MSLAVIEIAEVPVIQAVIAEAEHKIKQLFGNSIKLKVVQDVQSIKYPETEFLQRCADAWHVDVDYFLERSRKSDVVCMRGVICYFMRKKFQLSLTSIAEHLNLSNHTSILHALNNVNNMIDVKDEIFMKYFEPINKMLHEAQ